MKCTLASYEHSAIGFPGVLLKWHVTDEIHISEGYVTINGIIQTAPWTWENPSPLPFLDWELERFNGWVRETFANNASVQG